MGPMRAAREFALDLKNDGLLARTQQVIVRLYGSLALTGHGHGTDRAILLGLEGAEPETVDPDSFEPTVKRIRAAGRINLLGEHEVAFDEPMQLLFMRTERLPHHSNGMRFTALGEGGAKAEGRGFLFHRRRLHHARRRDAGERRRAHAAAVSVRVGRSVARDLSRERRWSSSSS